MILSLNDIEFKKIDIESPLEYLKIGDEFNWKGTYHLVGYQEGFSKIKRFYKEVPFWFGVEKKIQEDDRQMVSMELENNKKVLLGYIEFPNNFVQFEDWNT